MSESPSIADRLLQEVLVEAGGSPGELPILYDQVDPDALETLVQELENGEISFDYAGYEVTIESDAAITIDRPGVNRDQSGWQTSKATD